MISNLRTFLIPIGFLANFFFFSRFFHQWMKSEQLKKSTVPKTFWKLSLIGHLLFALHGFLQFQVPVCLIQTLSGFIAWRNLNLMGNKSISTQKALVISSACVTLSAFLLLLQSYLTSNWIWMKSGELLFSRRPAPISLPWHILGLCGICLFSSRFWIQWALAEKRQKSELSPLFWQISILGAIISLIYFTRLNDLVNVLGFSFALIPALRNLFLFKGSSTSSSSFQKTIFLFAGEQSADQLGASLLPLLKERYPDMHFWGVGGQAMKKEGFQSILPLETFQVMGFTSVFAALPRLLKSYFFLKREILIKNPMAVICIDSPDFTLRLEKGLRRSKYRGKLIHYVCPSIWAWRKKRKAILIKNLDALLCILPFEKELFAKTSLSAYYVGHPLIKAIKNHSYNESWKSLYNIPISEPLLSLFPGSRSHVIEANLPLLLSSVSKIKDFKNFALCISVANPALSPLIESLLLKSGCSSAYLISSSHRYEQMKETSLALATSGTINLELALHKIPTVVVYKVSTLNYFLGKSVFKIRLPYFSLPNIILNKTLFPEFIGKKLDSKEIAAAASSLLREKTKCNMLSDQIQAQLNDGELSLVFDNFIIN